MAINRFSNTAAKAILVAAFASFLGLATSAQAQSFPAYSVVHAFTGNGDGAGPFAALLTEDAAGNLYGTTNYGGSLSCDTDGFHGCGTIFKVDRNGVHTVLYSFTGGADGRNPYAGLIRDATGNLFGTTAGGFVDGSPPYGNVFKLTASGELTVIYSFQGGSDGAFPTGGLIRDPSGNFYGITEEGGDFGHGTIFKLDTTSRKTTLYSFRGAPDGQTPLYENLVMDPSGNLYGTTYDGGSFGQGTVFKVNAQTGAEQVLYSFANGTDGGLPYSGLLLDAQGNLYGTTSQGGGAGAGTVFKIDPTGHETQLYRFAGGRDAIFPMGSLVRDAKGNFWGTSLYGGALGFGTIYMVTPGGQEILVHSFNGAGGDTPWAGLTRDITTSFPAVFFGTTASGGRSNFGTVFKIKQ